MPENMKNRALLGLAVVATMLLPVPQARAGTAASFVPLASADEAWIVKSPISIYNTDTGSARYVTTPGTVVTISSGTSSRQMKIYGNNNGGLQICYLYAVKVSDGTFVSTNLATTASGPFNYTLSVTVGVGTWATNAYCGIPPASASYSYLYAAFPN